MSMIKYLQSKLSSGPVPIEEDLIITEIIKKMCNNPKTYISSGLGSYNDTYYLKDETLDYAVIISEKKIQITNHSYTVTKLSYSKLTSKLTVLITERIQRDHDQLEAEIRQNEIDLLMKISSKLGE